VGGRGRTARRAHFWSRPCSHSTGRRTNGGSGLDLSDQPLHLTAQQLAAVTQPVLLVSASDSPQPLRAVCFRLAALLPQADEVRVPGGHLIDPAHPAILGFVERNLTPAG
jgi:pimeloyl-ACP methyl ester carboxylesterase